MSAIITLPGWGQPADVLKGIAPEATHVDWSVLADVHAVCHWLSQNTPAPDVAVGWSLGGWLLLQALAAEACIPKKLVLLGAPVQFVSDANFEHGMDSWVYDQFLLNYKENPARTASRFGGLISKGDTHARRILVDHLHTPYATDVEAWLPWLQRLGADKAGSLQYFPQIPELHIVHGDQDAIVPHAQAQVLADLVSGAQVHILPGCGHAPHWHAPDYIRALIDG